VRERFIREARAAQPSAVDFCDLVDYSGMFAERPFLVMSCRGEEPLYY